MTITEYLAAVDKQYRTGIAREHAYRGDLQQLLTTLCPGVLVTNEPARVQCGAPDYILTKKDIPVGYIEAKDINVDLGSKGYKEQFDRYRGSLENLIITDYLEFRFFKAGEATTTIRIGEVVNGKIKALPAEFDKFTALIADFAAWQGQTIGSAKKLAEMMAGKARLLADVIEKAVSSDEESQANTNLREQLEAFKVILIHDIAPKSFADLYAQTIAYGMFAARLHDPTPDSFSRMEAAQLIPKSNPFLRKLFQSISGYDLDERIVWIVDALADIFRATDIAKLLAGFGKGSGREDAFMHFYEDFLAQYDPKLRKSRGVWYTPDAVVRFIVRAVDDILKTEFGLSAGLADASKVKIKRKVFTQGKHGNAKVKEVEVEEEVHRVQVLDPATGTGTFLAEVVRQVHAKFEGQAGMWPQYVEQHLIPRLNGFELLMASYAMAHLKLDLVLRDTGYDMGQPHGTPKANSTGSEQQRLRVFLTNSLEEAHPETGTLFASWLSQEANEANAVKRETPVMVVLGNPPYSGHSSNNGEWISDLVRDYYQEPSGGPLQERTTKWLNDDYVKFIRFGEHFIENTGEGVLAYINNHSFLDNPTFRGMRWHLLNTFDKIHVIDLHGNSKKKEVAPDGGKDENVFDIIQGVSVNLFVRTGKKKKGQLGCLYHTDVWGTREVKYDSLSAKSHSSFTSRLIEPRPPFYFFLPVDNEAAAEYERCLELPELFALNNVGMTTAHDEFVVDDSKATLQERFTRFKSRPANAVALHTEFDVREKAGWNIIDGWTNLQRTENLSKLIEPLTYRPFDNRYILYEQKLVWRTGHKVMQHFQHGANIAILLGRQGQVVGGMEWNLAYITNMMTDFNLFYRGGVLNLPLYLYPETTKQTSTATQSVQPNLDAKLVEQLAKGIGLTFTFNP